MSRIRYQNGKMTLVVEGDIPSAFTTFVNNCDNPDSQQALKAVHERQHEGDGLHTINEKPPVEDEIEPLHLSNRMNTFRITRSGRFRTADLVEHQISHDRDEKVREERKAEAISFEEIEMVICTGCRQEPIEGDPCCCARNHEIQMKESEMERADRISQMEEAARIAKEEMPRFDVIPHWLKDRLAREAPVIKTVKFTRLLDPCVLERGTWLRDQLKTEITL